MWPCGEDTGLWIERLWVQIPVQGVTSPLPLDGLIIIMIILIIIIIIIIIINGYLVRPLSGEPKALTLVTILDYQ